MESAAEPRTGAGAASSVDAQAMDPGSAPQGAPRRWRAVAPLCAICAARRHRCPLVLWVTCSPSACSSSPWVRSWRAPSICARDDDSLTDCYSATPMLGPLSASSTRRHSLAPRAVQPPLTCRASSISSADAATWAAVVVLHGAHDKFRRRPLPHGGGRTRNHCGVVR